MKLTGRVKLSSRVGQVFAARRFEMSGRGGGFQPPRWGQMPQTRRLQTGGRMLAKHVATIVVIGVLCQPCLAETPDVPALVRAINAVGPEGVGHRGAMASWRQLMRADAAQIPEILTGMDGSGRLAANWLRSAIETIAQRQLADGGKLPQAELEALLADVACAPKARRLAYELIRRVDSSAERRLIPSLLNDPSLELRRDAVSHALAEADAVLEKGRQKDAVVAYRRALTAARDLDQINQAAKRLRDLGETVDLPTHFGFVLRWKLVGPFDNTNKSGFDVAYGPELSPDVAAEYEGKEGVVRWVDYATDDEFGNVDLNKAMGKLKDAITYAYAEFASEEERDAEFRLGCTNGNKLWVNGDLLFANTVYHTGFFVDQYVAKGRLRKGKNTILLKIAQNNQDDSWAQDWQFQLRVCDQYGTAILSTDRGK